ncbi:MAG: PD40 domain-containing protein [Phycisphaerales bacterium]|nr:PD40 domain-containing protein [Phycisphaerales bacterium]
MRPILILAVGISGLVVLAGCQMNLSVGPRARADAIAPTESNTPPPDASRDRKDVFVPASRNSTQYEGRLLTNVQRHSFTEDGRDFDPDVDAGGQTLVFASTRYAEHPDLFLKNVEGLTLTQLTSDPADDVQPRFSPDSASVVFASNRSGSWDIWTIKRDGTERTQLTAEATDEMAPCWSPDGSQIAYTVWGPRSGQWEIWTLTVAEPGVRHFLAYGMFPSWSSDGKRIAFQRPRQRGSRWFSIWTITLEDGEARQPTEIAFSDSAACVAPRWSPNGEWVVYSALMGGAQQYAELWMVDATRGLRFRLSDGAEPAFNPTWGANGRVYYVSPRAGAENIWSLSVDARGAEVAPVAAAAKPDNAPMR